MANIQENDKIKLKKLKKRKWSHYAYFASLGLVSVLCGWQTWMWWSWAIAPANAVNPKLVHNNSVQISIPSGTGVQQIGRDLQTAGLIRSLTAWKLWTVWLNFTQQQGSFKAGTYNIGLDQSLPQIALKIWQGDVVATKITIPEGWRIQQMAEYFQSLGYFSAAEFISATQSIPRNQYTWLPENLPHLEGFLYPDTYQFSGDKLTPQQVITMMLDRFEEVALPVYRQGQKQTQLNLLEWVTLGSIVEKEAVIQSERPRIAGVFVKRLEKGMKLETDPTVEYGLNIRQTADQPLTWTQVKTPSPYNTYLNPGLPPTPIASPGIASLKAALAPEDTVYLYFVAKYDGTHVFSKTLQEHQAAAKKIREQRQEKVN